MSSRFDRVISAVFFDYRPFLRRVFIHAHLFPRRVFFNCRLFLHSVFVLTTRQLRRAARFFFSRFLIFSFSPFSKQDFHALHPGFPELLHHPERRLICHTNLPPTVSDGPKPPSPNIPSAQHARKKRRSRLRDASCTSTGTSRHISKAAGGLQQRVSFRRRGMRPG